MLPEQKTGQPEIPPANSFGGMNNQTIDRSELSITFFIPMIIKNFDTFSRISTLK